MSKNCSIMNRMKSNYENRQKYFLTRRIPVIIRIDGKAFYSYTKGLNKPFDEGLIKDMQQTAIYLCENIQGAKCAYVQSDEISILITDYDNLNTQAWFNYSKSKIESVSSSFATGKFNQLRFLRNAINHNKQISNSDGLVEPTWEVHTLNYIQDYFNKLAFFDSRAFNIPKEEVANYFLARQLDAVKNSISMVAQSLYSFSELHKKNQSDMQEMIFQKGINWNDFPFEQKRGSFIIKQTYWDNELVINEGDTYNSTSYYLDIASNKISRYDIQDKQPVIRNKWEVIETPIVFNEQVFNKWL